MRKYLYFMSADAVHLRQRLEHLAQRGLELTASDGLFTGEFAETQRNDLRYFVVPYGKRDNFPSNIDSIVYGWELVGGFNGMALYKSLPCVEADEGALLTKLKAEGSVHEDKHSVPLMQALLFLLAGLLFLLPVARPELGDQWYLSWFGVCLPVLRLITVGALVVNILTFRTYAAAWIHGMTPWVIFGALWLTLIISRLDDRGETVYFTMILLLLACAGVVSMWNMLRKAGFVAAGVCVLVLCLGLIFPTVNEAGNNLRGMVKEEAIVTLSDVGDDSHLTGCGFETEGTVFVNKATYWEISEAENLICEHYQCLTWSLAQSVYARVRSAHSGDGAHVLWKGKYVWVVKCSADVSSELLEAQLLP